MWFLSREKATQRFFKHLFYHIDFPETRLKPIGGGVSKLEHVKPVVVRDCEETSENAIILDADNDVLGTRIALSNEINRLSLPIQNFFSCRTTAILAALKRYWKECLFLNIKKYMIALIPTRIAWRMLNPTILYLISRQEFMPIAKLLASRQTPTNAIMEIRDIGILIRQFCNP